MKVIYKNIKTGKYFVSIYTSSPDTNILKDAFFADRNILNDLNDNTNNITFDGKYKIVSYNQELRLQKLKILNEN